AGADTVDPDTLARNFSRQAKGKAFHSRLGSGVVDVLVGAAVLGGPRGDINNRSAPAIPRRRHAPHRFAGTQNRAKQVYFQHAPQYPGVEVGYSTDFSGNPGV